MESKHSVSYTNFKFGKPNAAVVLFNDLTITVSLSNKQICFFFLFFEKSKSMKACMKLNASKTIQFDSTDTKQPGYFPKL